MHGNTVGVVAIVTVVAYLKQRQMIDKVGQLMWSWFSHPRKAADKIVEPRHMAIFIASNFIRCQLASRIHNSRMQTAKSWQN